MTRQPTPTSRPRPTKRCPIPTTLTRRSTSCSMRKNPLIYAGEGRHLRRRVGRAEGVCGVAERARHHHAEGQGRISGKPPAVRRRAGRPVPLSTWKRAMSSWQSGRVCRLGASPTVFPNRRQQDHHPVQPRRVPHQPHLPHATTPCWAMPSTRCGHWPTACRSARAAGTTATATSVAAAVKASRDSGLAKYREAMASDEKPINPYRVFGDMMKALDPMNSFVTHDSGNTRDQLSTVYDTLIPRGLPRLGQHFDARALGWPARWRRS